MSAFFPCDPDVWFEEMAPFVAGVWPERVVIQDLRFWENERRRPGGRPWPSRAELGRRWTWGDWKVRRILLDEAKWKDTKNPVPRDKLRAPRTPTHQVASKSPTKSPTKSPPSGATANADISEQTHQVASKSPTKSPTKSPPSRDPLLEQENNSTKPMGVEELWDWLRSALPPTASPGRNPIADETRKALKRILADGWTWAEIELVWRWRCLSKHERAYFLRKRQDRWPTVAAHFETYLGMAQALGVLESSPQTNGHGPEPPTWTDAKLYDEARRRLTKSPQPTENLHDYTARIEAAVAALRADLAAGKLPPPPG